MKATLTSLLTDSEILTYMRIGSLFKDYIDISTDIEIKNISVKDLSSLFFVLFQKNERVPQGFMSVLVLQELMERAEKKNIEIF